MPVSPADKMFGLHVVLFEQPRECLMQPYARESKTELGLMEKSVEGIIFNRTNFGGHKVIGHNLLRNMRHQWSLFDGLLNGLF